MLSERSTARDANAAMATPEAALKLVKRSVAIQGHRTSISLENAFWSRLKLMAEARGLSVSALISSIDAARGGANLSSAIRVAVLEFVDS